MFRNGHAFGHGYEFGHGWNVQLRLIRQFGVHAGSDDTAHVFGRRQLNCFSGGAAYSTIGFALAHEIEILLHLYVRNNRVILDVLCPVYINHKLNIIRDLTSF